MSFKTIYQRDSMDCGPACLAMLCNHYDKNISLADLRELTQIGKEGVNILGISEAAESLGFKTLAVQLTCEQLAGEVKLPCILHWSQNHFTVLTRVKKKIFSNRYKKFVIADPSKGLVSLDPLTFKRHWLSSKIDGERVGVALLCEPGEALCTSEEKKTNTSGLAFKKAFAYLLAYKNQLMQLLFSIIISSFLQLLFPFLTQSIVDTGIDTSNLNFIYIVLMAQVALFIGKLTVDFIRSWILLHISTRINVSILTDFIIKMMKLPLRFFDSKQTGDILQRMDDHQRIESFLTGSSLNALFSIISLLVFSVVLAVYHLPVFFIFILSCSLYVTWIFLFLKKRKELDYKRFGVSASEQSAAIQMIQGMQEIKLQGCEKQVRWNWERIQAKLFNLNGKTLSLDQWQQSGALFINEGKNILITFVCAKAVIDGQMTLGVMLAVNYIIGQLNGPVEQLITFVKAWQGAKISMERLNEIHHLEDEEPVHKNFIKELPALFTSKLAGGRRNNNFSSDQPTKEIQTPDFLRQDKKKKTVAIPSLTFNKVSFTYPGAGNEPVLKEVSLNIPSGKTTAIVGGSGSGKTTLLKLLLRFYDPQKGKIHFGDTPFNVISHTAWRKHCGVVMQDSFIFSDSIAANIAVGVEKTDMERLRYAARIANIQDFISGLPLGFNTKIGPEGGGISMGQRQRILIARAVYRDPEYIFLDEATNSLDSSNEKIIIENLEQFFNGKTVVVVAHRLSTVKHADQIIVIDKGKIAERGTHPELVNLKGHYYTLVKNQLELGN